MPRFALRALLLGGALLLSACGEQSDKTVSPISGTEPNNAAADKIPVLVGSSFDFYVLSLSWSPQYCASKGRSADTQQCKSTKPFGFIVHGLWPQNERGYPKDCTTSLAPTRDEIRAIADLTPSAGLVRHEWQKHGSCSGLSPDNYFKAVRAAHQAVVIPAQFKNSRSTFSLSANQIENSFMQSNPLLKSNAIAVACDSQKLTEVRVCMTKSMQFRACPEVDRAGCRVQTVTIEPVK